ncbi:MAG TPA: hypothetical protein VHV83_00990, partial [Armatimonadota bacterium]|nr:hypothetical protein [Armatimonadota bacterium]
MRNNHKRNDDAAHKQNTTDIPPLPSTRREAQEGAAKEIGQEEFTQRGERIGDVNERKAPGIPPQAVPAIASSRALEAGPTQGKTHHADWEAVSGELVGGKGEGEHRETIAPPGSEGAPTPAPAKAGSCICLR